MLTPRIEQWGANVDLQGALLAVHSPGDAGLHGSALLPRVEEEHFERAADER